MKELNFQKLPMNTNGHRLLPFMEKLLDGAEVEWKALGDVLMVAGDVYDTSTQSRKFQSS